MDLAIYNRALPSASLVNCKTGLTADFFAFLDTGCPESTVTTVSVTKIIQKVELSKSPML